MIRFKIYSLNTVLSYIIVYVCVYVLFSVMSNSFVTPWTITRQAPLSMGFSKQEYWNGCHALLQGTFLNPGTEPTSPVSPALACKFYTTSTPQEAQNKDTYDKPIANILNFERVKFFSSKVRNKSVHCHHSYSSLSQSNQVKFSKDL